MGGRGCGGSTEVCVGPERAPLELAGIYHAEATGSLRSAPPNHSQAWSLAALLGEASLLIGGPDKGLGGG